AILAPQPGRGARFITFHDAKRPGRDRLEIVAPARHRCATNLKEPTMKATKTLISCFFIAASSLSSTAFAELGAHDEWLAQQKLKGLPVTATPSVPQTSSLPILVEMSLTEGDYNRAAIARRLVSQGAIGNGNGNGNGNGHANGNGNGNGQAPARFICD